MDVLALHFLYCRAIQINEAQYKNKLKPEFEKLRSTLGLYNLNSIFIELSMELMILYFLEKYKEACVNKRCSQMIFYMYSMFLMAGCRRHKTCCDIEAQQFVDAHPQHLRDFVTISMSDEFFGIKAEGRTFTVADGTNYRRETLRMYREAFDSIINSQVFTDLNKFFQ